MILEREHADAHPGFEHRTLHTTSRGLCLGRNIDRARPNGLPISRAALMDRDDVRSCLNAKIATILSTRSGVGCMGGLGRRLSLVYGIDYHPQYSMCVTATVSRLLSHPELLVVLVRH